jgi:hypothetical protein
MLCEAQNGNDTIRLQYAAVTGDIAGGIGNDNFILAAGGTGSVKDVYGDNLDRTDNGNDVFQLLGATAVNVYGVGGNDTINLDGSALTGSIFGDNGNDTINLTSGCAVSVNGGNQNDIVNAFSSFDLTQLTGIDGSAD